MKSKILSLFFIVALGLSVSAQTAKPALQKNDAAIERMRGEIVYLASDKLEGRRTGSAGAFAAASYIAVEFRKIGLQPGAQNSGKTKREFLQEFKANLAVDISKGAATAENQVTAYNVVGVLPGKDAALKTEAIIIGAHYDHLGHGGSGSLQANSTEIHHGADDNASGVAAILEMAREFASEKKNRRTLVFIAFGGEEEGLQGSKFYANNPPFPLDKTVAMINLDMVGRLKDDKLTIGGVGTASEWKDIIAQNNKKTAPIAHRYNEKGQYVPIKSDVSTIEIFNLALNEDGFGPSDHSSFYGKKIPVLFFFTGTHADYHKPSDTAEKINYEGLKQVVSFASEIVRAVDASDKPPTYQVTKSNNTEAGRRGFNVSLGTIPSYSENTNDGLAIDGVRESSPAEKAGLKAGDKIVSLAGKEIRNISDYTAILGELKAGEEYEIEVARGAERLKLKIVPAPRR